MINYTEIDNRVKINNPDELLKQNKVVHVNKFNEGAASQFRADFMAAHETGQDIVPILIDSFGGQVYSLLSMIDLIKSSDKPVATITLGKAMSCGAVLLTCGDEGMRYAAPTSTVMIHDVSSMAWGKIEELKADANEAERLNKLIFSIMEKNIGAKKNELLDILRKKHNSADWFITPQQAKKLNIVNHVRVPKFTTRVTVETELR